MGCSKNSYKRKVQSPRSLPQETNKNLKQSTYHLKESEKEKKTKPQVSRRNKIIKMREEIHTIDTKIIEKINKIKS